MATTLSDGYIYFVESEAVGGDDWINDHAGDPDALDLDLMTEGTEYCKLKMPEKFKKLIKTGMEIVDSGGGNSFQLRTEARSYALLAQGIASTRSNSDLIEKFITIPRHTAAATATYKDYYLIFRFGASDYVPFTDHDGNVQEYCRGGVLSMEVLWDEGTPLNVVVRLNFKSIWN